MRHPFRRHHRGRAKRQSLGAGRMVKVLPSLFTLGNLLCGFAAVFYASRMTADGAAAAYQTPPLVIAASLVFAGMIFDALDGRVARLTRQTSELGEQLDSMADMVTFGVAPAFLVIQLVGIGTVFFSETHPKWNVYFDRCVFVVASVYVACAALRLARFNIEVNLPSEKNHMSFKGLPSPAAAGAVTSLVLLHQWLLGRETGTAEVGFLNDPAKMTAACMVPITLLTAIAMVSTLRYVHAMNRFFRDRAPTHYIGAALFILIPLMTVPQITLAVICVVYALSAPFLALVHFCRRRPSATPTPALRLNPQQGSEPPTLQIKQQ